MSELLFEPPKSTQGFLQSDKFINLIVGAVGSGKTTAGIIKITEEAKRIAPCRDGVRRSRCVWVRNTREQLRDTTLPDFLKWYPDGVAGLFAKTEFKFTLRFTTDDSSIVECEVLFRGLDDTNDVRRLLSLNATFGVLEEFREINPDIFTQLQTRLGRYPDKTMNGVGCCEILPGGKVVQIDKLWGMSNAPDADTFWEDFLVNPPGNAAVFFQPSGMSPEADWLHFLKDDYYQNICEGKTADWVDVYVHAKFGRSLAGLPVWRSFNQDTHVAKEPISPQATTLILGADAGLNPTVVITQQAYDGRIVVLDGLTGNKEGMGALLFCREKLKPLLTTKYPNRPAVIYIDPTAFNRGPSDERSVADIFKNEGFLIKPARTNAIAARIASVDSYLTRTVGGKSAIVIDPRCTELIQAIRSKYRYKINQKGEREDKPEKSHPWSDYCFVAGTPVLTPWGHVPIEDLREGDVVCVPNGVDVITHTGSRTAPVLTLGLSDGTHLTCTLDHPFSTKNHTCLLDANALSCGDILETTGDGVWANEQWNGHVGRAKKNSKPRHGESHRVKVVTALQRATDWAVVWLMELSTMICGSLGVVRTNTSGTSAPTNGRYLYIDTSGQGTTGLSTLDMRSTTSTATQRTMRSATSKVFLAGITRERTWPNAMPVENLRLALRHVWQRLSGTGPQQEGNGTESTRSPLPLSVVSKDYRSGVAPVFNLTTERTHLFYAGNVLVHNCDSLQYACLHHDGGRSIGGAVHNQRKVVKPAPFRWAA